MHNIDLPPARADRFTRAVAKLSQHRATELHATTPLVHRMAGALARYWLRAAMKERQ